MISSYQNLFNRESLFSSSSAISNESISSGSSDDEKCFSCCCHRKRKTNKNEEQETEQFKQTISYANQILFFGPLVLCLILLITGVIIFIIVEQRNKKQADLEIQIQNERFNFSSNDSHPLFCSYTPSRREEDGEFALSQLACVLNRSSLLSIRFPTAGQAIHPGQNLWSKDVRKLPRIFLNNKFLSKIPTESFLLIFACNHAPSIASSLLSLYWIRYYSSSLKDEEDVCYYEWYLHRLVEERKEIFLFYATNSSQMMIQAKTFCTHRGDNFPLLNYISFLKLRLISATYFIVKWKGDDNDDGN